MIRDILLSRLTFEQRVYQRDAVLRPVEGLRSEIGIFMRLACPGSRPLGTVLLTTAVVLPD
jgi:hypothetical protein